MTNDVKSIRWTVTVAMIFVAYLAWGFMAGSYAENSHVIGVVDGGYDGIVSVGPDGVEVGGHVFGDRGLSSAVRIMIFAVYSFIATSILETPNFFRVVSWHCSNRIWLPILFALLEAGIVIGGVGLHRLEKTLSHNRGRQNC